MGVPGLTSFMNNHFHGWRKERVSGQLVVDGYSLCHRLYTFEWSRGGQYPEYREYILDFFKSALLSGIQPLVVFDGIDYKQEKVSTTFKRRRDWIRFIHSRTTDMKTTPTEAYGTILPMLAIEVFQLALRELEVPTYVVDGEADSVIVEIANFFHCPVLASDSDYYMYNVYGGYIPIDRFHWKASPIVSELFFVSEFAKQFNFQHENLRLIIPGVVGNDYLKPLNYSKFLKHIADILGHSSYSVPYPITLLVRYTSRYKSLEDFLSKSGNMFLDARQLKTNCDASQLLYTCKKTINPESLLITSELCTVDGADIPDWLLRQYRSCSINRHCMNTIVLGKSILRIIPDDSCKSSAFSTSLPVRQKTYSLLRVPIITEYIRCDLDLVATKVYPIAVPGAPDIASMPLLLEVERLQLFCIIVGCDYTSLMGLAEKWRFVASVTKYWTCQAKVPLYLIHALVNCNLLCFAHNSNLNKIRKKCNFDVTFAQSRKWKTAIYMFAQWQCCYFDLMSTNQLLMNPLKVISPAFLFDGTIALSLVQDMSTSLSHFPISEKLSKQLLDIILVEQGTYKKGKEKLIPSKSTVTETTEKRKRNRPAALAKTSVVSTFIHSNPFSLLSISSDSSQCSSDESTQ